MDEIHEILKKEKYANFRTMQECADHMRMLAHEGKFKSANEAYRFAIKNYQVRGKSLKNKTERNFQKASSFVFNAGKSKNDELYE